MACFIVPAVEAIVVTAAYVITKKMAMKLEAPKLESNAASEEGAVKKISTSRKLSWLMALLWGGVLLLAFEHFWHGEVVPYAPFLTAMATPEDTREMLIEMATVGTSMAVTVTAVWGAICLAVNAKVKKLKKDLVK